MYNIYYLQLIKEDYEIQLVFMYLSTILYLSTIPISLYTRGIANALPFILPLNNPMHLQLSLSMPKFIIKLLLVSYQLLSISLLFKLQFKITTVNDNLYKGYYLFTRKPLSETVEVTRGYLLSQRTCVCFVVTQCTFLGKLRLIFDEPSEDIILW